MKFTNEHYAMCDMIGIVNSTNNFIYENGFSFEQYYFHSMPSEIRQKQQQAWLLHAVLDADYFSGEGMNGRIHHVVKELRSKGTHPMIAKILVEEIKRINNSKSCKTCSGDGFDEGRLKIPSLESIDITYRKENGLPLEVENK